MDRKEAALPIPVPPGYQPLSEESLPVFLQSVQSLPERLGGNPDRWTVREVGDGNLNLVFAVEGPDGRCCVKQSLPYLRLVGEGWPIPLERAYYEHECLRQHARHAAARLPEVYSYDSRMFCIVMELLTPHVIMRRGMIDAIRYPSFAGHMADYCANVLFHSSDLHLRGPEKRKLIQTFAGNSALCGITEDVIFTEPYMLAERNRWTSPQLDGIAAEFRADAELKLAVARLKHRFMALPQALIHGDLHTGSIMVTETDTRVIDPEFAFCGPMGFDLGAVIGNLLINYFSQDGHATESEPRTDYQEWVLTTAEAFWLGFRARFRELWERNGDGDAYPKPLFADPAGEAALAAERERFLDGLLADTLGFAAAKMIRRILGIAHNIDLEWIADPDRRAACETRCLRLARELMLNAERFRSMAEVAETARTLQTA